MFGSSSLNEEIAATIGIWFLLVVAMMVMAMWTKRDSRPDGEFQSAIEQDDFAVSLLTSPRRGTAEAPARAPNFEKSFVLRSGRDYQISDQAASQLNPLHTGLETGRPRVIEGTLQRIDYLNQELRLVVEDNVWCFALDSNSQLWFDDKKTVLRCFHPLDHVKIVFAEPGQHNHISAMYAWEQQLTQKGGKLQ